MNRMETYVVIFTKYVGQSRLTSDSFTIELAHKSSAKLFPVNTSNFLTNYRLNQLNLEGQWLFGNSETSYSSFYQFITEGQFIVFHLKNLHVVSFSLSRTRSVLFSPKNAEAINTFKQERHHHSETCKENVEVSRWTQKNWNLSCKWRFHVAFYNGTKSPLWKKCWKWTWC